MAYHGAMDVPRESVITCPQCGHRQREAMPLDYFQFFYECQGCGAPLRPKPGDCCGGGKGG